jgi:hypothetical protein
VSAPRRPYGNPPGRLPATMIKVLAAEMSDQGRLARGKRYYASDAVIDIVVGHGAATAEIQGSRARPYVVTIDAEPGSGVPSKRQIHIRCTCPDDSGMGDEACKHAVAAMFALSDEIAIEPELLDRWRGGSSVGDTPTGDDDGHDEPLPSNVVPLRRERATVERVVQQRSVDEHAGEIARLLASPGGGVVLEFPDVDPLDHRGLRDPVIADVLDDALAHLRINWD